MTVSLTEAGRQLIAEVLPVHIAAIVEAMSTLSPVEQEVLGRLCRQVGKQERQIPVDHLSAHEIKK